MKTAEEILTPLWNDYKFIGMSFKDIAIKAMKIYAKEVAKVSLEEAAINADLKEVDFSLHKETGERIPVFDVDEYSITSINIITP